MNLTIVKRIGAVVLPIVIDRLLREDPKEVAELRKKVAELDAMLTSLINNRVNVENELFMRASLIEAKAAQAPTAEELRGWAGKLGNGGKR